MSAEPQPAGGPRRLEAAVLDALFSQSPIGLHVLDPDLRLVRVNTAAYRINEFPVEELLGRPLRDLLTAFRIPTPDRVEAMAREVLATGVPVLDLHLRVRSRRNRAVQAMVSVSGFRLEAEDGAVLGLATAVTDITERAGAEARLRLLNEAASRLGTTLDVFRTAEELCELVVPGLADSVAVDVLDLVLRGDAPDLASVPASAALRRAGFRSVADRRREGVPRIGEVYTYPLHSPHWTAVSTLRPKLIRRLSARTGRLDPSRPRDARLLAAGVHSMMVVPMLARGVVLGLVSFYRWRNQIPFGHADLAVAEQLATQTALCMDNARLYQREHSATRILRRSRHRPSYVSGTAAHTAGAYLPVGIGGAFVDVIPLSGARIALVAGDTTGPNGEAVLAMGELRAALAAMSDLDIPPDEILHRLHDLASGPAQGPARAGDRQAVGAPSSATCLYAIYDPVDRLCTLADAGHPLPVLIHADGRIEQVELAQGPALGQAIAHYPVTSRVLPEGSTLLLHTAALLSSDGTPVRLRLDLLPDLRLADGDAPLQEICEALLTALSPAQPRQDAALLLARAEQLDGSKTASWTLPNRPDVVSEARRAIRRQLEAWSLDGLADATQLIVSELVTNSVRYAHGPINLRLIHDHALTCEITDDSSTAPQLRRALESDENGRGLFITAQLTDRWGVRPTRRGKTIWAEQPIPPPGR